MADLADKIDDLICTFEENSDFSANFDTIAMYLFALFLSVLLLFSLFYYIYGKFKKGKTPTTVHNEKIPGNVTAENVAHVDVDHKNVNKLSATISTPLTRKRLGSRGSKINLANTSVSKSITLPPSSTGSDADAVKWVNSLFVWLYSDLVIVNELVNIWIQSLNEFMKQSVAEHGVGVELIRLLPETHAPVLNNIFCECASNDDISITCDCETTAAMQLKAFRQKGEKVELSHYRINLNKLRGRLNIHCLTEKLQAKVKFDGWPEVKFSLAVVGTIKNNNLDEQSLQDVIVEIVTSAVRATQVNFDLYQYPTCPRFSRRPVTPVHLLPVHYDSMTSSSNSNLSRFGEKLLVKIVKATGLATDNESEVYCVIEVDNPSQTYQTSCQKNTNSPMWNEHFLFNINTKTNEIMFEIYDKVSKEDKKRFMGVAIIGMDELMSSPSQRQVISLQSRPYQNDNVTGTLTLEFLFIENADINSNGERNEKSNIAPKSAIPNRKNYNVPNEIGDHKTNGVTELNTREYDMRNKPTPPNKSTLIIHSVQKKPDQNVNEEGITDSGTTSTQRNNRIQQVQQQPNFESPDSSQQNGTSTTDDMGRSRRRRRDFFGTIRKRLGRSKNRARSVDRNGGYVTEPSSTTNGNGNYSNTSRSASVDRARDHSAHSTHSTVGPLPREGSARSSLSEMSGMSGASSRTYLNDASTLLLECTENGIKKYYLVPLSLAQRGKWKRKGVKLHIYNNHTFVAKHLPGGTICQVCDHALPRRLGKQGYECRDCNWKCHKQCHVKTDNDCPQSTIQGIELSGSLKLKIGNST